MKAFRSSASWDSFSVERLAFIGITLSFTVFKQEETIVNCSTNFTQVSKFLVYLGQGEVV